MTTESVYRSEIPSLKVAKMARALSLSMETSNLNRVSELEYRVLAVEKNLAEYETPYSESTPYLENFLRKRSTYGTRSTAKTHIEVPKGQALFERFQELKERWLRETAFISSPRDLFLHLAYQQIIGLGSQALPLLLAELRDEPRLWFWALRSITGANPIPEGFEGGIEERAKLWLDWGELKEWC